MKTWKIYLLLFYVLWLGENIYFGWNLQPQSFAERICDFWAGIFLLLSVISWMRTRIIVVVIGDNKTKVTRDGVEL